MKTTGQIISGDIAAIHNPGRCGDRVYLVQHKHCSSCGQGETRLEALFCCWCGTRFSVVVTPLDLSSKIVLTPIGGMMAESRALPLPAEGTEDNGQ